MSGNGPKTEKGIDQATPPAAILERYARVYPRAWDQAAEMRAKRGGELGDWPDWCFLPLAGAAAIIEDEAKRQGLDYRQAAIDCGNLGALIAWRMTRGIYRFDPDVYRAVWETPITGDLPADVLFRLPEWCVWIETPEPDPAGLSSPGFFAYLEADAGDGRAELRITIAGDRGLYTQPIHLNRGGLADCIAAAIEEGHRQSARAGERIEGANLGGTIAGALKTIIEPRVNLVLYLCAVNSEIRDERTGFKKPGNPAPIRTRRGLRLFPAATPTRWDVAVRLGAAIRSAAGRDRGEDQGGTHASPRPHIRRAHWHTFRRGPGRAESVLKWLPPIPVNVDDADLPAVLRDVK